MKCSSRRPPARPGWTDAESQNLEGRASRSPPRYARPAWLLRTMQRRLATHSCRWMAGVARQPRTDRGRRRVPPEPELLIEDPALTSLRQIAPPDSAVHLSASQSGAGNEMTSGGCAALLWLA